MEEKIIKELFDRGCSMVIAIGNKRLFYDRTLDKWVVSRGYKPIPRNDIHVGDHFWQAFEALCGATQHGVQPTREAAEVEQPLTSRTSSTVAGG